MVCYSAHSEQSLKGLRSLCMDWSMVLLVAVCVAWGGGGADCRICRRRELSGQQTTGGTSYFHQVLPSDPLPYISTDHPPSARRTTAGTAVQADFRSGRRAHL